MVPERLLMAFSMTHHFGKSKPNPNPDRSTVLTLMLGYRSLEKIASRILHTGRYFIHSYDRLSHIISILAVFGAEVSGQLGTSAELSHGHFGIDLCETLRPHYTRIPLFEERYTDFHLR